MWASFFILGRNDIMRKSYEKHEIVILESYWERLNNFKEVAASERTQYMNIIIEGLTELHNTLDTDLKTIIQMRYFDKEECNEWEDVADHLGYSRSKTLKKRILLLNKTVEAIGFV